MSKSIKFTNDTYLDSSGVIFDKEPLDKILVYSTKEQIIGKWIDGKPLYRRCFTGTTANSNSTVITKELNSSNCSIKNMGGFLSQGSNSDLHMNIGGYINSNWYCGFYITESVLNIYHPTNLGGGAYELFVEYTKTTD